MGAKIEAKSMKNRIKFEAQDEVLLGIDFWSVLVDLGTQDGAKNSTWRARVAPKGRQKKLKPAPDG